MKKISIVFILLGLAFSGGLASAQIPQGIPQGMMPANIPTGGPNFPGGVPPSFGEGQNGQDYGAMMEAKGKEMERLGKEKEAAGKAAEQKGLVQMKKGAGQMAKQVTKIKTRIAKLQSQGLSASEELSAAITKAEEIIGKINAAETSEGISELMDELANVNETLSEEIPRLEMAAQYPRVLKQAKLEMSKLDKALVLAKAKVAKSKVDLSSVVTEFATKINETRAILTESENLVKAKKPQEAFDKLEEYFSKLQETWDVNSKFQALTGFVKYVAEVNSGLVKAKAAIKKLESKKVNVTEVKSFVTQFEQKLTEVKAMMKQTGVDTDTLSDTLDQLEDMRNSFEDKLSDLKGEDPVPGLLPFQVPQIDGSTINKLAK